MFFRAFCPGEVLAVLAKSFRALQIGEVGTQVDCIIIFLRQSKTRPDQTDQRGWGQRIVLRHCPEVEICPLDAVGRFLNVSPPPTGGYLLIHFSLATLTLFQFRAVFLGLPSSECQLYAFRIGAASLAAHFGLPPEVIQYTVYS